MALRLKHDGKDIEIRFGYVSGCKCSAFVVQNFPLLDNTFFKRHPRRCSIAELSINGEPFTRGMAVCHPKDNFSKVRGRKIALAKALEPLDKLIRRAVWDTYKESMKV